MTFPARTSCDWGEISTIEISHQFFLSISALKPFVHFVVKGENHLKHQRKLDDEKLYANLDSSYLNNKLCIAVARGGKREAGTPSGGGQARAAISGCSVGGWFMALASWTLCHVRPHYVKPRRGMVWRDGHWKNMPRGFVWVKGHWR